MSSLGLSYAPHLDATTAFELEHAGRRYGLALAQIELLGQSHVTATNFISAVRTGTADRFLAGVDWDHLEHLYQSHKVTLPQVLRA